MSSRLPYGIHIQTGAATFKREVEQSLAPWREMIARDDARVVRSIHCPQLPNAVDGFSPIVLYQIALRDTGKVVQVSIQGKHDPLPNPVSAWSETRAQSRKRKGPSAPTAAAASGPRGRNGATSSEGQMVAAKRRLRMIQEGQEGCQAGPGPQSGVAGDADCHAHDDLEDDVTAEHHHPHTIAQRKRAALGEASGQQQYHHDYYQDDGCNDDAGLGQAEGEADEEVEAEEEEEAEIPANVIAHVSLHPPTPTKKPSKPSSRRPGPPRYSARRSTSLAVQGLSPLYGLGDLREPDHSIRYFPSTAANSEAGDSCSGETTLSNVTYTQQHHNLHQHHNRTLRRSSRLASLPPGTLDDEEERQLAEQVRATVHRLAGTVIEEGGMEEEVEVLQEHIDTTNEYEEYAGNDEEEDVDMSSMILDYEDPEESRLAREQIRNEEARRRRTSTLPRQQLQQQQQQQQDQEELMSLDQSVKEERSGW